MIAVLLLISFAGMQAEGEIIFDSKFDEDLIYLKINKDNLRLLKEHVSDRALEFHPEGGKIGLKGLKTTVQKSGTTQNISFNVLMKVKGGSSVKYNVSFKGNGVKVYSFNMSTI
jgi:hypothetical protein